MPFFNVTYRGRIDWKGVGDIRVAGHFPGERLALVSSKPVVGKAERCS